MYSHPALVQNQRLIFSEAARRRFRRRVFVYAVVPVLLAGAAAFFWR